MVFSGENDDGYVSGDGNLQQEDQQQASQEEAARLAKEEQERREQEELLAQQEEAALQEEANKLKSAHDATDQADQELQQGKADNAQDLDAMVKGNVGNLGDDLRGIIESLAKTGVESGKSNNSRGAGLDGMKRQSAGVSVSGPDGGEDGNDPSKGDQGASR